MKINWATKSEKDMSLCIFYIYFIAGACAQPLGSFIPFLREAYGFTYEQSGMLLSFQSVGSFLAIPLAGLLPLYIGRRKCILILGVWMSVGYFILANGGSPAFLISFAFMMTGVSRGAFTNFASTLVSTIKEPAMTQCYNINNSCYALGAFLSPLLLIFLINMVGDIGWRYTTTILFVISLTLMVVYAKMPIATIARPEGKSKADLSFLKNRTVIISSIMLFFYVATEYSIVGWLVTYFQDTGILSDNLAQIMSSFLWVAICTGRFCGSFLVTKFSKTAVLRADAICLFVFFMLLITTTSVPVIVVALMGVGFSLSTIFPFGFSIGTSTIKGNDLGCSFLFLIANLGGVVVPIFVGIVAEHFGIQSGMYFITVIVLLQLTSIFVGTHFISKEESADKEEITA